jgi:hypothetical protein
MAAGAIFFSRFAIILVRDANLIEIENQFGYTSLYMFVQILHCSLEKRSRHLQWPFVLCGVCSLGDLPGMTKDK